MKAVVQRVKNAQVTVEHEVVGSIEKGLLVYLGIGLFDTQKDIHFLVKKIEGLRVFPDEHGVMNENVVQQNGKILVVSQFTLLADVKKGFRPSYSRAAPAETAKLLYEHFLKLLSETKIPIETGKFQAHMDVTYTNDGPFTIILDSKE